MADVLANAIPLTSGITKLYFIGFDAPTGNGLTSVTVDSVEYTVIDDGNENNSWVLIDGQISGGRIVVTGDFPDPSPVPSLDLRLPTEAEWDDERLSWSSNNTVGAFGSPLKLTLVGDRNNASGALETVNQTGQYWSSSISGTESVVLGFIASNALMASTPRAYGFSVRLILDGTFTQQQFDDNYSPETIEIDGITYGYCYNDTTDRIWLDRNLGASQVATTETDNDAYGWLFQWGRLADGHQLRDSSTTAILSSGDVPGNSNFITVSTAPNDWRDPQNDNLWQGVDGINVPT